MTVDETSDNLTTPRSSFLIQKKANA